MEELTEVLKASPGSCPAFRVQNITPLLRMCPLQVEAIQALEAKFGAEGGSIEKATGLYINIFVPVGGGMRFNCKQYKGSPKPGRDLSYGKPVMTGHCPFEEAVVNQLIEIAL